jgi:hypothetical protein
MKRPHRPPRDRSLLRAGLWLSAALGLLLASREASSGAKPKVIDLQELSTATILITFKGTISTDGTTQSLVYAQPIPAEDGAQTIVEVGADGGDDGTFTSTVEEDGPGRRIVLSWEKVDAAAIPYEIRVKVLRESFKEPLVETSRGKDEGMLVSGALTSPSKEIKQKAAAIVKGAASDLEAVLRLAQWINENITYDLNYSQDKQDKTVPQVFKNKRGTCDELSHLFISMARAAGIPAREVSGLAFNGQLWGFHSWSEVKLGDRWVPVDATNMQIGFVDATHLAFARDADDAKFEQNIVRLGEGAFTVEGHSMDVRIWKASKLEPRLEVAFSADPAEVPPGWDFGLAARITNISSSIVAGPVRIVIPEAFIPRDPVQKTFLLAPGSSTTVTWSVGAGGPSDPEGAYVYSLGAVTFPRVVAETEVTVATRIITAVGAFKGEGDSVSVDVTVTNLFKEKKTVDVEACFYAGWDMKKKQQCVQTTGELAASAPGTITLEAPFKPEGNFAVEVNVLCGGLSERRILNVDIAKQ